MKINDYYMAMAYLVAQRSTCLRRKVGTILVDKENRLLSSGYNGNASGLKHCIDSPCQGADQPSGDGLELCEAIHAEQNAVASTVNPRLIHVAYCTTAPCHACVKLLLATSCQTIVFQENYPHTLSRNLWIKSGRIWKQYKEVK